MSIPPLPRYSLLLRMLRISLVTGAIFEVGIAAVLVLATAWPAVPLAPSLPDEVLTIWLLAILLTLLNACYLLGAWEPVGCRGVIAVAIAGRTAVAGVLGLAAWGGSDLKGLVGLAVVELALALAHTAFWLPIRR